MACLNARITLTRLVDWADHALAEEDVVSDDAEAISASLARLGLADVRAFGLTWQKIDSMLASLGYHARVQALPA
ncbi:MAG: hypothetical protein R2844_02365 [Caldilineales bacterium]